jgi:RND family efflux transporter MFP subunit
MSRTRLQLILSVLLAAFAFVGLRLEKLGSAPRQEAQAANKVPGVIEAVGKTQCVPQRKGIIAPAAPPHPVIQVLVGLGDRVKKGQALIKIDDDELKADLQGKQASLAGAEAVWRESQCRLETVEKLHESGAVGQEHYHESLTAAARANKEVEVAKAGVEGAKAELEHFTVTAAIDGIINRLDVHVGTVSRPGTTVWGEILDLSELDVRCDLTPEQVDSLAVGNIAEVRTIGKNLGLGKGRVVFIGLSADRTSGLVPVLVRFPNPDGRLRCEIPVQLRLAVNDQPTKSP